LTKVDDTLPDIELPFRGFQLIVRKQYDVQVVEVDVLDETTRGDGGFGSTG
jgi:dUTPase